MRLIIMVLISFIIASYSWATEIKSIRSAETVSGTIESASSTEEWLFYGETNQRVLVSAIKTSGSMSGVYLKLYDKDSILETQNNGNAGIDHQLKKTGLYKIAVEANPHGNTGNYTLTFQKIPGPVTSPEDMDGGTIFPGTKTIGYIHEKSDIDAYQFYGLAGDIVSIYAMKKSGNMSGGIYLRLYPDSGEQAESQNLGAYGINYQLKKTGLYTIIAEAYNHSGTGKYELVFTKNPATFRPGIYFPEPEEGALVNAEEGAFSWYPLTGVTGYDLYFGKNVTEPLKKIGNNLSYPEMDFPELESGSIYYWQVIAHSSSGDIKGPYFWFEFKKDTTPPVDGTLTATPGSNQVSLSWSGFSDTESGINRYKLVYSTGTFPANCSEGTQLYSGINKSYVHKGLTNDTTYYYRVCAIDNKGNISSGVTASATPSSSVGPDLTGSWKFLTIKCIETRKGIKCKISGKLNVRNSGQQDAPSSSVKFFLSENNLYETEDMPLKKISTGKIKAGKSKDITIQYNFSYGTSLSGKYIIAVIDFENVLVEADENNNTIIFGPLP